MVLAVRMDTSLFSVFVVVLLLAVIVSVSFVYLFSPKYDPREPPVISSSIPYVGHILGLLRYGQRYFEILRSLVHWSLFDQQAITNSDSTALVTTFQSTHFRLSINALMSSILQISSRPLNATREQSPFSPLSPSYLPEYLT